MYALYISGIIFYSHPIKNDLLFYSYQAGLSEILRKCQSLVSLSIGWTNFTADILHTVTSLTPLL